MATAKYWCFTENDNPNSFVTNLNELFEREKANIKYICGQLEEVAHRHFQGYVQLHRSRSLSWVRNHISTTAHFERQKGTNTQARDYCKKVDESTVADSYIEKGRFTPGRSGQGARNDVIILRDKIKEGTTQRALIEDDELVPIFAKYIKFADRVRSLYPPQPRANREVCLYIGKPGTGKTRKAMTDFPAIYVIPITNGTLWLDGYDDHPEVLFDDFMGAGSKMTLDNTLKFFDRYVQQVPIKGSYTWFRPSTIIVTSNYHPRNWYKWDNRETSYSALKRRFTQVLTFSESSDPVAENVEEYFDDKELWPHFHLEQ